MNENPYASPGYTSESHPSAGGLGDVVYYRSNTSRLSYADFWRISNTPVDFLLAAVLKTLQIRLPVSFAFAGPASFRLVDSHSLPEASIQQLRPLADQSESCGLQLACTYESPCLGATYNCCLGYVSTDGLTMLHIVYVRMKIRDILKEQLSFSFLSYFSDGRLLITSGTKRHLNPPPEWEAEYLPNQNLGEAYKRHRARLDERSATVVPVHGEAEVFEALRRFQNRAIEFQLSRGVFVVATPQELEVLARVSQPLAQSLPEKSTAFPWMEIRHSVMFLAIFVITSVNFGGGSLYALPESADSLVIWGSGLVVAIGGLTFIWSKRLLSYFCRRSDV